MLRATIFTALISYAGSRYGPISFPTNAGSCAAGLYFDVSSLACLSCPTGQEPDAAGTSCVCADGKILDVEGTACVDCPDGAAPTADRSTCLACTSNDTCASDPAGFTAATGVATTTRTVIGTGTVITKECSCPGNTVVVERDGHGGLLDVKRCRACPSGTYKASASECRTCPASNMVASSGTGCRCETGYTSFAHANGFWGREVSCVKSSDYTVMLPYYSATGALTVRFLDLETSVTVDESKIMQQLLLPAAAECLQAVTTSTLYAREQQHTHSTAPPSNRRSTHISLPLSLSLSTQDPPRPIPPHRQRSLPGGR